MRTLVHLSDLHFGRVDARLLAPLAEAVAGLHPDVVVISGDLTQRARRAQFREAAEFLARLPTPQIVVPGNHDVPLYDVARRFVSPLGRFRRSISPVEYPYSQDDELAVIGVNTARSLTFKGGRINARQVAEVERRFRDLPEVVTRVVVTHHPFDLPQGSDAHDLVGRAPMAMQRFAGCGVDLFLAGHLHQSSAGNTAARYRIGGFAALVLQAGTATSTRGRGEANAFNVLRIGTDALTLRTVLWDAGARSFAEQPEQRFRYRRGSGWSAEEA